MTITTRADADHTTRDLPDEVLVRFRQRAAAHDAENTYFSEDLAELQELGYLTAAVPIAHGGWGWDLARLARSQRRLARYAPATALGTTMHHYWIGGAATLEALGDPSLTWLLTAAVDGDVIASGHAEGGNDLAILFSSSVAERTDGGYRISGHKLFGSNGPVWDWLGGHAMVVDAPGGPQVVHAFIRRDSPGVTVVERWDTLGMRASQSYETVLDGVEVPDARVARVVPAGDLSDPFLGTMQLWAITMIANVYLGIGERAFELAIASARSKTSLAIDRGAYAYNPFVQHQVADMYLELDAARATVDALLDDVVDGVDHGVEWGAKIFSAKWRAVEATKRVCDLALDVTGGGGMFRGTELERLYRDARCGGFHPANDALAHEMIGKTALGIQDELPRW